MRIQPARSDDLAAQLTAEISPDATLLIKDWRGMALERLLPMLDARFGPSA